MSFVKIQKSVSAHFSELQRQAAALDGASGWRLLRWITLPQLKAASAAVIMLLLINAFQAFDEFYNMLGSIGSYPPYGRPPLVHLFLVALGAGGSVLMTASWQLLVFWGVLIGLGTGSMALVLAATIANPAIPR